MAASRPAALLPVEAADHLELLKQHIARSLAVTLYKRRSPLCAPHSVVTAGKEQRLKYWDSDGWELL